MKLTATCLVTLACVSSWLEGPWFEALSETKKIVVNLHRQKLIAYENGKIAHEFDCITGRAGKETNPGSFRVHDKKISYTSRRYKAPMPYSIFFTPDRKAIHASPLAKIRSYAKYLGIGEPGSHGCVGLSEDDAKWMYEWTPIGTIVEVVKE